MATELNEADTERAIDLVFDRLPVSDCQFILSCLQSIATERDEALGRVAELEKSVDVHHKSSTFYYGELVDIAKALGRKHDGTEMPIGGMAYEMSLIRTMLRHSQEKLEAQLQPTQHPRPMCEAPINQVPILGHHVSFGWFTIRRLRSTMRFVDLHGEEHNGCTFVGWLPLPGDPK